MFRLYRWKSSLEEKIIRKRLGNDNKIAKQQSGRAGWIREEHTGENNFVENRK